MDLWQKEKKKTPKTRGTLREGNRTEPRLSRNKKYRCRDFFFFFPSTQPCALSEKRGLWIGEGLCCSLQQVARMHTHMHSRTKSAKSGAAKRSSWAALWFSQSYFNTALTLNPMLDGFTRFPLQCISDSSSSVEVHKQYIMIGHDEVSYWLAGRLQLVCGLPGKVNHYFFGKTFKNSHLKIIHLWMTTGMWAA